jgi:ribosomal subunit interface protein
VGQKTRSAGRVLLDTDRKGFLLMDIVFKGRHTDVLERFRKHATGKLAKVAKLDHKAIRIDVEVTAERNPRQSDRKERVELTITTRGPAIRAEAAAEDRFAALDLALAKLEARLRRSCDRRKARHVAGANGAAVPAANGRAVPASRRAPDEDSGDLAREAAEPAASGAAAPSAPAPALALDDIILDDRIPVEVQGNGPLVVREKFHVATPMSIDQALFEMELLGHDFFLFTDVTDGLSSVVYRRRGYQYGVIRLVEEVMAAPSATSPGAGARVVTTGG